MDKTGVHVPSGGYLQTNGILAVVMAVARDLPEDVGVLRLS